MMPKMMEEMLRGKDPESMQSMMAEMMPKMMGSCFAKMNAEERVSMLRMCREVLGL